MLINIMLTIFVSTAGSLLLGGTIVYLVFKKKVSNLSLSNADNEPVIKECLGADFPDMEGGLCDIKELVGQMVSRMSALSTQVDNVKVNIDYKELSRSIEALIEMPELKTPEIDVLALSAKIAEIIEARRPQDGDESSNVEKIDYITQLGNEIKDQLAIINDNINEKVDTPLAPQLTKIIKDEEAGFKYLCNSLDVLVRRMGSLQDFLSAKNSTSESESASEIIADDPKDGIAETIQKDYDEEDLSHAIQSLDENFLEGASNNSGGDIDHIPSSGHYINNKPPTVSTVGVVDKSISLDTVEKEVSLRNLTVMMVDDSNIVRKINCNHFKNLSVTTLQATNGIEAKRMLEDGVKPNVILLDVEMPKMDGFEFAEFVRKHSNVSNVPIIMFTSKNREALMPRADVLGVYDMVEKDGNYKDTLLRYVHHLT